tara:strand:+ start:80 stop:271 length:192 start_codon:yes stop_codon:yes gene_type:complete
MPKTIRATITVEVPYENELLNYGNKLNAKIREVINNSDYITCEVEAGNLEPNGRPILRLNDET